jgi:hypothetical protein
MGVPAVVLALVVLVAPAFAAYSTTSYYFAASTTTCSTPPYSAAVISSSNCNTESCAAFGALEYTSTRCSSSFAQGIPSGALYYVSASYAVGAECTGEPSFASVFRTGECIDKGFSIYHNYTCSGTDVITKQCTDAACTIGCETVIVAANNCTLGNDGTPMTTFCATTTSTGTPRHALSLAVTLLVVVLVGLVSSILF